MVFTERLIIHTGLSASTKIYGIVNFKNKKRVKAIRHIANPQFH